MALIHCNYLTLNQDFFKNTIKISQQEEDQQDSIINKEYLNIVQMCSQNYVMKHRRVISFIFALSNKTQPHESQNPFREQKQK